MFPLPSLPHTKVFPDTISSAEGFLFYGSHVLDVLEQVPKESVHCCVTSPPYWGLRDYGGETARWGGVACHLGLEKEYDCMAWTRQEIPCTLCYVCHLREVFSQVHKALREDGTLWLNIGDCYSGSGKGPVGTNGIGGHQKRQGFSESLVKTKNIAPKNLLGLPWRVALALQTDGWVLRRDIIWKKINPLPESVKDRPSTSHEYVFLFSKSSRYYYDIDSIRLPHKESDQEEIDRINNKKNFVGRHTAPTESRESATIGNSFYHPKGKNRGSVWETSVSQFRGAHFATFPESLIHPMILAGSPKGGLVLDPFSGTATTGAVSLKASRNYVGIDNNAAFLDLALTRFPGGSTKVFEVPETLLSFIKG